MTDDTSEGHTGGLPPSPPPSLPASSSSSGLPPSFSSSVSQSNKSLQQLRLEQAVHATVSDPRHLERVLWLGVPRETPPRLRGRIWKLVLGYSPLALDCRPQSESKKVADYLQTRNHYFCKESGQLLSDAHLREMKQISVDIVRTHPVGFSSVFSHPRIQALMKHVLLLWAIRNPASGYVQGLNDLITPFVVVFLRERLGKHDIAPEDLEQLSASDAEEVEAQCYWCLSKLLSRVQDNFVFGQPGIARMLRIMETVVKRVDANLFQHLKNQEIALFHVCFRWMNCFLVREIPLEASIRLWDTYIAEGATGFSDFHIYVCVVFLLTWSAQLRVMDFQQILLFLQSVPTADWGPSQVETLVAEAFVLKTLFHSSPNHLGR